MPISAHILLRPYFSGSCYPQFLFVWDDGVQRFGG